MPDDTYGDRNPFIEQTLEELGSRCYEIAGELGSDRKRSIEERRALVERTRMLLLALGYRLHGTSNGTPGSPEQAAELADGDFVREFERYRVSLMRDGERRARRETLLRAANFALGRKAARWLDDPDTLWSQRRSYVGAASDAGFETLLRELEVHVKR
ncbi:MAG: hypothetical protein ACTHK2_05055 [Dokdonella sp.]|uniref:hypothetical protein n=1 Tax=Dokdonella sp. TaxID=2291710 RepID=UPI003F823301